MRNTYTKIFLIVLVTFCLILASCPANATGNAYWLEDIKLTDDTNADYRAPLVVDSDYAIHVVWGRDEGSDGWTDSIYYSKSTDNGTTWSTPVKIGGPGAESEPHTNAALVPYIALDSTDGIHVVWHGTSPGYTNNQVLYTSSNDGGLTWTAEDNLAEIQSAGGNQHPRIVTEGNNNLYVVWGGGCSNIWFTKSIDGGSTWSSPSWIDYENGGVYEKPDIAIGPDGKLHVTMIDSSIEIGHTGDVCYFSSINSGTSWSNGEVIYTSISVNRDHFATIEVNSEGTIQIVTSDDFTTPRPDGATGRYLGDLFYLEKTTTGSWSTPVSIAAKTPDRRGGWREEMILDSNDNLYLVYPQYTDVTDVCDIYLKKYDKSTTSWQTEERLTNIIDWESAPYIAMDPAGNLHVTYTNYNEPDVHYMKGDFLVDATIDLKPGNLNPNCKSKFITGYIELPTGFDVNDIVTSTVRITEVGGNTIETPIYVDDNTAIGDYDSDSISDLKVRFLRVDVENVLADNGGDLTVEGDLTDTTPFDAILQV